MSAAYVHSDIDAGIIPLRYAIRGRVWLDINADGAQQPDEPPAAAAVSLLRKDRVVASTTTDVERLLPVHRSRSRRYRVRFGQGNSAGSPRATRPRTRPRTRTPTRDGCTSLVTVGPECTGLVPAADLGVSEADLVNPTISFGLVGAYAVGDTVWRDGSSSSVLDAGEAGFPGVTDPAPRRGTDECCSSAVTTNAGRFAFGGLAAGLSTAFRAAR